MPTARAPWQVLCVFDMCLYIVVYFCIFIICYYIFILFGGWVFFLHTPVSLLGGPGGVATPREELPVPRPAPARYALDLYALHVFKLLNKSSY